MIKFDFERCSRFCIAPTIFLSDPQRWEILSVRKGSVPPSIGGLERALKPFQSQFLNAEEPLTPAKSPDLGGFRRLRGLCNLAV